MELDKSAEGHRTIRCFVRVRRIRRLPHDRKYPAEQPWRQRSNPLLPSFLPPPSPVLAHRLSKITRRKPQGSLPNTAMHPRKLNAEEKKKKEEEEEGDDEKRSRRGDGGCKKGGEGDGATRRNLFAWREISSSPLRLFFRPWISYRGETLRLPIVEKQYRKLEISLARPDS